MSSLPTTSGAGSCLLKQLAADDKEPTVTYTRKIVPERTAPTRKRRHVSEEWQQPLALDSGYVAAYCVRETYPFERVFGPQWQRRLRSVEIFRERVENSWGFVLGGGRVLMECVEVSKVEWRRRGTGNVLRAEEHISSFTSRVTYCDPNDLHAWCREDSPPALAPGSIEPE